MDYLTDSDITHDLHNIHFLDNELNILHLDGYIYKGDSHNLLMLDKHPRFFGSRECALKYIYSSDSFFLKRYKTVGNLKILNVTPTHDNIVNIQKFFARIKLAYNVKDHATNELDITYILLQLVFGLIDNNITNLNMNGLTMKDIIKYLQKMRRKYNITSTVFDIFQKDITNLINNKSMGNVRQDDVVPSRMSIKSLDKMVVANLARILSPLGIHGLLYVRSTDYNNVKEGKILMCKLIDRMHFDNGKTGRTCVPTEICIFEPYKQLKYINTIK
jgi:hypothetical protein